MRTGHADLPLHGGEDGAPFPVDRATYDPTVESLRGALLEASAAGR